MVPILLEQPQPLYSSAKSKWLYKIYSIYNNIYNNVSVTNSFKLFSVQLLAINCYVMGRKEPWRYLSHHGCFYSSKLGNYCFMTCRTIHKWWENSCSFKVNCSSKSKTSGLKARLLDQFMAVRQQSNLTLLWLQPVRMSKTSLVCFKENKFLVILGNK